MAQITERIAAALRALGARGDTGSPAIERAAVSEVVAAGSAPLRDDGAAPGAAAATVAPAAPVERDADGEPVPTVRGLWTDGLGRTGIRSLQVLIVIALSALVIWGGLQISIVVTPVLLALIVASSAHPLIKRLRGWGWPSVLATVVVLVGVVAVLGLAIWLVVELVINQWDLLSSSTVSGYEAVLDWVQSTFGLVIDQAQITQWFEQLRNVVFTSQFGSAAASGVTAGLSAVATFVTSVVLFVVVLFFFMKDGPEIWEFLLRAAPVERRARFRLMGRRAVDVMGGYVRGTVIVALVDAVFIGIGLWVIGVPLAFPLAVVVFICAFIPVVGATLAGIIAALVTLVTNGFVPAIIVVCIVVAVNQLEGNFLQPVVLGRSLRLHELVVLLALTIGTVLGGIIGTLLAVPIAAVGWALVKAWSEPLPELAEEANQGSLGRDPDAEHSVGADALAD